jgi:hypothetical protein
VHCFALTTLCFCVCILYAQTDHNNNNGLDVSRPLKDTFPSQDVMKDIQQVGITAYNRAYSKPNKQFTLSFKQQFGPAYYQVCQ